MSKKKALLYLYAFCDRREGDIFNKFISLLHSYSDYLIKDIIRKT